MVHSYKDLPLRLYQTGRKYRDERRPRQGLLRAKEFMMKDLYTFDSTVEAGLETYKSVRRAYDNLFKELNLPYLVAEADSGNMGGKLSHEYHFVSPKGEDNVWSCSSCSYVANEELVEKKTSRVGAVDHNPLTFTGISTDRKTSITIIVPRPDSLSPDAQPSWSSISSFTNPHALKKACPADIELDTGIEEGALSSLLAKTTSQITITDLLISPSPENLDLTPTLPGASCAHCDTGKLDVQKAIEVGHTFHLGTRYSEPLNAYISLPSSTSSPTSAEKGKGKDNEKKDTTWVPIQMGCHGIGVSRLIAASASLLSTPTGLQWPRAIAPFEVAVLPAPGVDEADVVELYDELLSTSSRDNKVVGEEGAAAVDEGVEVRDVVLDDREGKSLGWKMKDADLIGYPVVCVLGRGWKEKREVEVQCRRLGVKEDVKVGDVKGVVAGLLARL